MDGTNPQKENNSAGVFIPISRLALLAKETVSDKLGNHCYRRKVYFN